MAANVMLDIASLSGAGVAWKAGSQMLSHQLGASGLAMLRSQGGYYRAKRWAADAAKEQADAITSGGVAAMSVWLPEHGGVHAAQGYMSGSGEGMSLKEFAWGFVPGYGTYRAYGAMKTACQ